MIGGAGHRSAGWRWIFYVNVPIGIAALFFGLRFLREHTEPSTGPFDLPGFLLSGFGLASIAYALNEGPRVGWAIPLVVGLGLGGLSRSPAGLRRDPHAAPDARAAAVPHRMFRATNMVMAFGMASFIGLTFVLPLYLQGLRGLDPLDSGLTTFPQAIGILISSQIAGRIYAGSGPGG